MTPLLTYGDTVKLVVLTSPAGRVLNGKIATVKAYHMDKDRYEVALLKQDDGELQSTGGGASAVKLNNLETRHAGDRRQLL